MGAGPATVVSLMARGDLAERVDGGTTCKVREFALLSDGREVTLLDDRGWVSTAPIEVISLTHVVRGVYMAVLPDDVEKSGELHEWQRFVEHLQEAGIAITADELRALPYRIHLSVPTDIPQWRVT